MREPAVKNTVACNLAQVGGTQLPHLHHITASETYTIAVIVHCDQGSSAGQASVTADYGSLHVGLHSYSWTWPEV